MAMTKKAVRKPKPCLACGDLFKPTGNAAKFCGECADFRKAWGHWRDSRVATLRRGGKAGVGSGGQNAGQGSGIHLYRKWFLKDIWEAQQGHCNECYEELQPKDMILHHIDHNRHNNVRENLEGICKRCHQIEHECWLNFSKV